MAMVLKRQGDYDILKRVEEKLTAMGTDFEVMKTNNIYTKEKIEKLDKAINGNGKPGLCDRVSTLENWKWYITGGGVVLIGIITIIVKVVK